MIREKSAPGPDDGPGLRPFIENAPATVAMFDREMRYLAASRRWIADFNPDPPDLVGRNHYEVFPRLPAHMKEILRLALAGHSMRREREALARSDGRVQHINWEVQPWRDQAGEVAGLVIFAVDVTSEVEAGRALAESEARYRLLAENSPDIICRCALDGVIQYISPACRQLGYAPDELIGRRFLDFVSTDDVAQVRGRLADVVELPAGSSLGHTLYRARCKDGRIVWLAGRPAQVCDEAGQVVGLMTTLRDVTEQKRLEQELTESEARYRQVATQLPDVIIRYDLDGVIEYVSPAVRRLGFEPEALVGRNIDSLDIEGGRGALDALRSGEPLSVGRQNEFRLSGPTGDSFWLQGNPATVLDDAGAPVGIVSVVRDVSEQRQVEEKLAESEARYRILTDASPDIVTRVNLRNEIEYISPSVARYGYRPEDLIGRSAETLIHPDDLAQRDEARGKVLGGGTDAASASETHWRLRTAGGDYVWFETSPSLVRDEAGAPIAVLSYMRDVTERRAATEALEKSERKLRALFELAPVGITLTDISGRFLEFNEAFRNICGYEEAELKALDYWALTPAEYAKDEARQLEDLRATGRYGPYEKEYVRKDGVRIPLRLNGVLIESAEGQPLIWSMVEDISEQLKGEAVLIEARTAAEAAAVAKSEFLANMSHEIRTPLTGVVGFASLLEAMDGLPQTARRYARRISTSAETLLAVVNDVLDFSKLEARQMELDPQAFDVGELAETVADLVRDRAVGKGLDVVVRREGEAPPRLVGDGARLRQVLLNFLTNAVKFTDKGSITIATRYDAGGARLHMSVTDTGVGVPSDLADRLFQRFSQVDASSTRRHGGTGLGLAICKALIEMMDGSIGFASEAGRGSTFWFDIPAPVATAADEAAAVAGAPADIEVGRTSILVVDDVAVNRELISAMLSPFNVTLVEAASGAEAVKAAMAERFDLVLMDLQMPGMDGAAATRAIRANSDLNRATPILAISANVLPEQVAEARAAGMNDHIAKPIDPADLVHKIAHWTAAQGEAPPASA